MIICVTGASGFIGKNLVSEFKKENHDIRCVIRDTTKKDDIDFLQKNSSLVTTNLSKGIEEADIVYNLAGVIGGFDVSDDEYWESNYKFTKELVAVCDNKRIIHLSTAGIYGPCHMADENFGPNPVNIYEETKLAGEEEIKKHNDFIIIQPGWVLGKYDKHSLPIFQYIQKQRFLKIGNSKNLVQPVAVTDLISLLSRCATSKVRNETVIVAGEVTSFNRLYETIAGNLNKKMLPIYIPRWQAKTVSLLMECAARLIHRKPLLRSEGVNFFTQERTYDISKVERLFEIKPKSICNLIDETICGYKEENLLS